MTNPQPGWYRDPSNSSQLRWWDGSQWTSYTQAATGATNGTTPAGRVTTSSSAYSAVPAHLSHSLRRPWPSPRHLSRRLALRPRRPKHPWLSPKRLSLRLAPHPRQLPTCLPRSPSLVTVAHPRRAFLASPKRATQRHQRGLPTPRQRRGHTDQAAHLASPAHPRPPWRLLAQRSPQSRRNPPRGRVSKSSSPSCMCF